MATDPNSFANFSDIKAKHIHWDVAVNFVSQTISGKATLDCVAVKDNVDTIVLDTSFLEIKQVTSNSNAILHFELAARHAKFGSALSIRLPISLLKNDTISITIAYSTTTSCTALQWLQPSQTTGKVHPYLFSQCQIHARSLLPCQDSPSVKFTYTASIEAPTPLTVLMSAISSGTSNIDAGTHRFNFEQKIAIPSYLVALAIGNLKGIRVGPRSTVWSEPDVVEAAADEFVDTETFIATGESLLTPYAWGIYDLLLLPGSFPYGGMENPCLTFVTPTLLAGDRSLVDVVAHEIAHSWMGNLVTTSSWAHFWLNEGFTVFIERKILGRLHGEKMRHFSALLGWQALTDSVQRFGETNPLTALVPDLTEVDPDDSFSSVPYEKGFTLLFHLEQRLGGPEIFEPYVKAHVEQFAHRSINTLDWKEFLYDYFRNHHPEKVDILNTIDWDMWLYAPGMPTIERPFDTTLADACVELASRWDKLRQTTDFAWADGTLKDFTANQKVFFLDRVLSSAPWAHGVLEAMDTHYHFADVRNAEIQYRWQMVCLKSEYESIFPHVVNFISSIGRMKFVRPLYKALADTKNGKKIAKEVFEANRNFYHPIAATMIEKDLASK